MGTMQEQKISQVSKESEGTVGLVWVQCPECNCVQWVWRETSDDVVCESCSHGFSADRNTVAYEEIEWSYSIMLFE